MKSSTLVVLCAALALSVPAIAVAQSTTTNGTVGATVDSNGVSVNAGANGSATTDANGGNANGGTDAAAAGGTDAASGDTMKCEELGTAASIESMGKVDPAALSAATKVTVVPVADCDDTTRSALATAGGTNITDALKANAAVDSAIMGRGATMADVIGATVDGDTVTVYVESKTTTN
jgi:hypothetical protein